MSRTIPNANLQFCESQVILKAILPNGDILRLGTANLSNITEDDSLQYSYIGKLLKDSQVKISSTQSANTFSVDAENVDKELGLTINDVATSLHGAKIVASKVFSDPYNMDIKTLFPAVWYDIGKLRGALPNEDVNTIEDLSGNTHHGEGIATFKYKKINGVNALQFSFNDFMTISGSFKLAQVFAVVAFDNNVFSSSGSIIGSDTPAFIFNSGSSNFTNPLPVGVRNNGNEVSSPYNLGSLFDARILNIKTTNPSSIRSYTINSQDGVRTDFYLSELIGFSNVLQPQEEQNIEYILARKYGKVLPYTPLRTWDRKVLLVGEIASVEIDENIARIRITSDIAPNSAFISTRPVGTNCPLVFKGVKCLYSGPLTTCNKIYISEGGCSGRANQHHFGGVVIEGELNRIITGGIDTTVGASDRFADIDLPAGRNRDIFLF